MSDTDTSSSDGGELLGETLTGIHFAEPHQFEPDASSSDNEEDEEEEDVDMENDRLTNRDW